MKNVAVIGAGISGLRAALELVGKHQITLFEKSPSVGGRLATRRFGDIPVNHGADYFHGMEHLKGDPFAEKFRDYLPLSGAATDLPKAMRDVLQKNSQVAFHFNSKVIEVSTGNKLQLENGDALLFDQIIITAPVPQARQILRENILSEVTYTKQISFIGTCKNEQVKILLSEEDSERLFDENDDVIRRHADFLIGENADLNLKKWRYSRVKNGVKDFLYPYTPEILICGDAFDPEEQFNLGSAWKSGLMAARSVL